MNQELIKLRDQIDWILADKPNEEVQANLYSARLHVVRALNEINEARGPYNKVWMKESA